MKRTHTNEYFSSENPPANPVSLEGEVRQTYSNAEDDIFNILTHNRMITAFSVSIVMATFTICGCAFMAMAERSRERECLAKYTPELQINQSNCGRNRNGQQ
jgi:hypothetical protein